MAEKCIFCDPEPEALVYQGQDGIVLLDYPARPGHVLVGIREHHPDLHDVSPADGAAMFQLAIEASRQIVEITGAAKTYVVAVGDKDRHFHVHLIPKMADDASLGPHVFSQEGWASFLPAEPDTGEVKEVAQQIAHALKKQQTGA